MQRASSINLLWTVMRHSPNFLRSWISLAESPSLPKKEFWMRKYGVCLALTGAAVWLTGCGMQFGGSSASAPRGGLAVVDLDKVAAETGKDIQMKEVFQLQENSVKQQLSKVAFSANSQLEAKSKEYGETPSEDQQKELARFRLNASNTLTQLQSQANSKLGQYRQDQIAKFRTEIKPIAQEIAAKRGLSVVIPKNEGLLLAVDPGVDITEEVIKAYREKRPAPAAAPVQSTAKAPAPASAKPAAPARTASQDSRDSDESTK
jgi:Skp family chaperone for outer membrane proteins